MSLSSAKSLIFGKGDQVYHKDHENRCYVTQLGCCFIVDLIWTMHMEQQYEAVGIIAMHLFECSKCCLVMVINCINSKVWMFIWRYATKEGLLSVPSTIGSTANFSFYANLVQFLCRKDIMVGAASCSMWSSLRLNNDS